MPFWRVYYHVVWATHNREPLIQPAIEKRLYAYLVRKASEFDSYVYAINGRDDHVHMLMSIPPKHAVADVVGQLKGESSHDIGAQLIAFAWQRGYGVLTLGEHQRAVAQTYIENQKIHHADGSVLKALERCTDLDEGPMEHGIGAVGARTTLREDMVVYDVGDEMPF